MKIEFQDDSGSRATVAAVEDVCSIDKIISNAAAKDEASLIITNQGRDQRLQSVGEHLGNAFDRAVLKRDGAKVSWGPGVICFRKENDEGSIDTLKVNVMPVEGIKKGVQSNGSGLPGCFVE